MYFLYIQCILILLLFIKHKTFSIVLEDSE
jgi:hypothetical protein